MAWEIESDVDGFCFLICWYFQVYWPSIEEPSWWVTSDTQLGVQVQVRVQVRVQVQVQVQVQVTSDWELGVLAQMKMTFLILFLIPLTLACPEGE